MMPPAESRRRDPRPRRRQFVSHFNPYSNLRNAIEKDDRDDASRFLLGLADLRILRHRGREEAIALRSSGDGSAYPIALLADFDRCVGIGQHVVIPPRVPWRAAL